MSEINELWNSAKQSYAAMPTVKEAGIKEIYGGVRQALSKGKHAYGASRPTEGIFAGAKNALSGTKGSLAESLGGAQKVDGAFSLRSGLKRTGAGMVEGAGRFAKGKLDSAGNLPTAVKVGLGSAAVVGANNFENKGVKAEGLQEGKAQGADAGYNAGIADSNAAQSQMDPGVLSRLMEVFTGRQPQMLDPADKQMTARRQQSLQRILAGNPTAQ